MTLRYNHQGSTLYIEPLGDITMTAGPDTLKRINLITFGQIRRATLVINAATLTGAAVLTASIGTTGTGGTDTVIATMTCPIVAAAAGDYTLEIPAELIANFEDRNGGPGTAKSLVFKIDGTNTDTIQAAVVVERLHSYADQTPADVTATT
jgi:hypothetical protein